ncbi:MAG: hypothetical protein R3C11_18760 [Planctomycetaceae bacterium]
MAEERNNLIDAYKGSKIPAAFMSRWGIYFANVYLAYRPLDEQNKFGL